MSQNSQKDLYDQLKKTVDACCQLLTELRNITLIVTESIYHWK